jgi:hypothetical protein
MVSASLQYVMSYREVKSPRSDRNANAFSFFETKSQARRRAHPMVPIFYVMLLSWVGPGTVMVGQVVPFVGIQGGVSTLSSDGRSALTQQGLSTSLYTPENGPALNLLGGIYLNNYLGLQANYAWNRNGLTLSSTSSASNSFYLQRRTSSQQAFTVDFLIYFRRLDSRIRPYLAVGTGIVHFSSGEPQVVASSGTPVLPPTRFSSTRPVLDVPVGIDVALARRLAFRYSFSETISHNEVSAQLSPPGERSLANFRSLFGLVLRF